MAEKIEERFFMNITRDNDKTKGQLIKELESLRLQHVALLIKSAEERQQAEEAWEANQELLRAVIDAASASVALITADGTLQSMNRAGLKMIEADSPDQASGLCIYPLIAEEYRMAFRTMAEEVFKGESRALEFKMLGLKGKPLWVHTHVAPLRFAAGEIGLALTTTIDITERKAIEERLQQSEKLIRNMLNAEEMKQKPAAAPPVSRKKILVMDDEDVILDIAGAMTRSLGHEVELTKHGQSAIEKYRAAADAGKPFDAVILDLTIRGGMGGRETIKQLLEIDSNIKAIVSSGFSDDAVISECYRHGFKACLPKPYKLEKLRDTLNVLLS